MNRDVHSRAARCSTVALVLLLTLAIAGPANAGKGKDKQAETPDGPSLKLTVSTHHGFRPLTLTLTGELHGVEPDDQLYCHAGLEWEVRSPFGMVSTSKQDPRCLHPPEQVDVQFVFTKIVTLNNPGLYNYRLILHRRDGEVLHSNTQEVRVLRNQ